MTPVSVALSASLNVGAVFAGQPVASASIMTAASAGSASLRAASVATMDSVGPRWA